MLVSVSLSPVAAVNRVRAASSSQDRSLACQKEKQSQGAGPQALHTVTRGDSCAIVSEQGGPMPRNGSVEAKGTVMVKTVDSKAFQKEPSSANWAE